MGKYVDRAGIRYGRLIALEDAGRGRAGKVLWSCRCDCGAEAVVAAGELATGHTKSCGCLHRESSAQRMTTHGQTDSPEHVSWRAMRARCNNSSNIGYHLYGGRGIRVCGRWDDFKNFLADMGPKPSPEHSLDRIDSNGDYKSSNCRWVTEREQQNNRRNNIRLTFRGQTLSLAQWMRRTGINYSTLYDRLQRGWSVEATLSTPAGGD